MNLDRIKPETLAAGVMDYMPQSLAAHEYAERVNAALARLGLTDRLTLPPAPNTAIDELPAVVDVPLRKTLSVLMGKAQQGDASALATLEWTAQVAGRIFAGLHARASVYPLALPSHESLATLSQGVDALLPRKISTGWSVASLLADPTCDGIDDGVSLVRLFCTDAIDSVTELKDDNEGWVWNKALNFTNLKYIVANCIDILNIGNTSSLYQSSEAELHCPKVESTDMSNNSAPPLRVSRMYFEGYKRGQYRIAGSSSWNNTITTYLYIGCKGEKSDLIRFWSYDDGNTFKNHAPNLVDVEIGEGACQNLNLHGLTSQTAENMYNHILCRLKQDEPMCGEGVTITLGTTNLDKLEAVEEYNLKLTELTDIYGYTFA